MRKLKPTSLTAAWPATPLGVGRMDQAYLVDRSGAERLVYRSDTNHPADSGHLPIHVLLKSPTYELRARATLTANDRQPSQLREIATSAQGSASYELWGLGNYRTEGPLLRLKFAGDNLGHFQVDIALSDDALRMTDTFYTDQTCVAGFLRQLVALGAGNDA